MLFPRLFRPAPRPTIADQTTGSPRSPLGNFHWLEFVESVEVVGCEYLSLYNEKMNFDLPVVAAQAAQAARTRMSVEEVRTS